MNHLTKIQNPAPKGQGALEYLLLIGGAVLIATIVLLIIISSTGSTNNIIGTNLNTFQTHVSLGAGGGGPVSLCVGGSPNGAQLSPEECDTLDLAGNDCTSVPGGFTGGTLACDGLCRFDTSSCTSSVPPSISLSPSTGIGSGQLSISYTITGFDSGSQPLNRFKGFLVDPVTVTVANFDSLTADFQRGTLPASGTFPVLNLAPNTQYFIYMRACNTAGCTISSMQAATTSYDAVMFESESFNVGSDIGLRVLAGSFSNGSMASVRPSTCLSGDGSAQYTVNLDSAVTAGTYYVWLYTFNTGGAAQPLTIDAANFSVPNAGSLNWVQATNTVTLSGGSTLMDLVIPCSSFNVAMDKVLVTTAACVPANDADPNLAGQNCA